MRAYRLPRVRRGLGPAATRTVLASCSGGLDGAHRVKLFLLYPPLRPLRQRHLHAWSRD